MGRDQLSFQIKIPVVSVVTRAFNCQRYIAQAIKSILGQTFQDFEMVIVDDASTDGTAAILQSYAQRDDRIRVFRNETNQGPVKTMNIGLKQARGEFVAVQDADDLSLPHRLETEVSLLRAHPQIAMVGSRGIVVDEEGEELRVSTHEFKDSEEVKQYLREKHLFTHSSVMFRRKSLEAIGWYDEFFLYSHDYDVYLRLAEKFDILYYEEPLVRWRWLNTGISGRKKAYQAVYGELARARSKAKRDGIPFDLCQEYDWLMAQKGLEDSGGSEDNRPASDMSYYYSVGIFLLERGKPHKARERFRQALGSSDNLDIFVRILIFYLLSFWPGSINSRPVRALRKAL